MANICSLCKRRLLSHSPILQCFVCKKFYHVTCLPYVTKDDCLYTERETNQWLCIVCSKSEFPFNHYDDEIDFLNVLSELWFTYSHNLSFESLTEKIFNPFELNNHHAPVPVDDIDPDIQYYNDISLGNVFHNSNYFIEDSFVEKCESLLIDSSMFSLLHMNIRSIPRHLHELEAYISNLHHEFSIIAISETWFSDATIDTYQMEGYAHEYQYRKDRCGGGVSLFVKNNLSYILRKDLILFNQSVECLFIELQSTDSSRSNSIIVGVIYRPPNTNITHFNESLSTILDKVKMENKQVYLSRDYNINLINTDKHQPSAEFLESMFSYSLYPMINRRTRIRESSATLIDNIFSNVLKPNLL